MVRITRRVGDMQKESWKMVEKHRFEFQDLQNAVRFEWPSYVSVIKNIYAFEDTKTALSRSRVAFLECWLYLSV